MPKVANIDIIGPLGLFENEQGEMEGNTLQSVIAKVQAFKGQEIGRYHFRLGGPGGFIDVGEKIRDYMVSLRTEGISLSTQQVGDIGSMMTALFLVPDKAKGETREVDKNFEFFLHNPWGETVGDADEMRANADELDKEETKLRKLYKAETDITDEGLDGLMKAETSLTAEEAIKLGFATGFVEEREPIKALAIIKHKSTKMSKENETKFAKALKILADKVESLTKKKDEPKALDLTLDGGGTLRIDSEDEAGAVGASAMVVDADGNESQATEGEHALEDGRIAVIDTDGKVLEIRPTEEEPTEEVATLQAKIKELENYKKETEGKIEDQVAAKLKEINTDVEKLSEGVKELEKTKAEMKAMKVVYKVPESRNFVKELEENSKETLYDQGKAMMEEAKKNKPKFTRAKVVSKNN